MTAEFGKVAVLLGGPSAEREVSLMSGNGVLAALREKGVDAHPFDPAQRDLFDLKREGFARVFIALHGRFGEDGTVQGALETLGIPYTGSGVMASALATDKWRTKLIWLASGIPTPKYRVVDARTDWMRVVAELGLPLIVKPAREGSTIGITKVAKVDHDELSLAYAEAARHDDLVLVEEFVTGAELTASIVNDRALPLIRIEAPQGNYDYHAKYFSEETKYHCPAGLSDTQETTIRAMAMRAYDVVGCSGWGRLDLILRGDGTFSFLKVNTSPGMTPHSLVPMAAKQSGMSYPELCVEILKVPMWDDAKQMNAIAATLTVLVAAAMVWGGVAWAVRQPAFALREVVVVKPLERASAAHLEAVVREELAGTFFTMDLARAQRALAQVPWVRNVALRRQWPHRLEIEVDEHAPFARWNDAALVNSRGEVFNAEWKDDLPQFQGQDGRAAEMTAQYNTWTGRLAPLSLAVRTLRLSARGSWHIDAIGPQGPLAIELGRDDADARLTRFVAAQPRTLGALAKAGTRVEYVDLRYRNGFAARVPQFREKAVKPAA